MKLEIKRLLDLFKQMGDEVNWNKDKILQKDSQIKSLKDKITKQQSEIENSLKRKKDFVILETKDNNSNDIRETLFPVKPKPLLFGEDKMW